MKNKKVIILIVLALIFIAIIFVFKIQKSKDTSVSQSSVENVNEVVNEINTTNEIVKNTTDEIDNIQENIVLESEVKIDEKVENDVKEIAASNNKQEIKQIENNNASKKNETIQKTESSTSEQSKVTKDTKATNNKQIEKTVVNTENKTKEKAKTSTNNQAKCEHSSSGWYNTESEAIAVYKNKLKYWEDKWANYEIDDETFFQNKPNGYETWDCAICHKWTINIY